MNKLFCRLFHYLHWTTPHRDDEGEYRRCTVCGIRHRWDGLILDAPIELSERQRVLLIQGSQLKAEDALESWYRRNHGA